MKRRKRIAFFTSLPEGVHARHVTDGMLYQCQKYDYDLCVFGSMTHLQFDRKQYLQGEANIFNLCNFSEMDGVILDTTNLNEAKDCKILAKLCERIKHYPKLKVCALELPIDGITTIEACNDDVLKESCRHIIEHHHKKRICILTGQKDNYIAESRLSYVLDEIKAHDLSVLPDHLIYGDFWYSSGDRLGEQLINGEISMPEAVICTSDHMALGLIDKLITNGIRVPEDLIVVGFDYIEESASNRVTLSSYDTGDIQVGANSIDWIRKQIEPDEDIIPYKMDTGMLFHPGMSCGCQVDLKDALKSFRSALYCTSRNYADPDMMKNADIGLLMESYVLEDFTGAETIDECLYKIQNSTYLASPFRNLMLCLREDWTDMDNDQYEGYPDTMKIVVANGEKMIYKAEEHITFPTEYMIPQLYNERDEASVFYFSSVHFVGKMLGYSVLQRNISDHTKLNLVYRNWLRFINNSLEMIRAKRILQIFSIRDEMTGAFNRRGMYDYLERMIQQKHDNDKLLVCVVDMDKLKYINDTFGHHEGDFGINLVCSTLSAITEEHEICIRAGGDEFYLLGIGQYPDNESDHRKQKFLNLLEQKAKIYEKPYPITASIGSLLYSVHSVQEAEEVVRKADEKMYQYKVYHRKQRTS